MCDGKCLGLSRLAIRFAKTCCSVCLLRFLGFVLGPKLSLRFPFAVVFKKMTFSGNYLFMTCDGLFRRDTSLVLTLSLALTHSLTQSPTHSLALTLLTHSKKMGAPKSRNIWENKKHDFPKNKILKPFCLVTRRYRWVIAFGRRPTPGGGHENVSWGQ